LFKEEVKKASSFGDDVKLHLDKGDLIPTKMVLYALVHAIQENKAHRYVVEGFPATAEQAQEFSKMSNCDLFLCLNQSDDYINDLP